MSTERNIKTVAACIAVGRLLSIGAGLEYLRDGRTYSGVQIEPLNNIYSVTFKRCDPDVPGTKIFKREMFLDILVCIQR